MSEEDEEMTDELEDEEDDGDEEDEPTAVETPSRAPRQPVNRRPTPARRGNAARPGRAQLNDVSNPIAAQMQSTIAKMVQAEVQSRDTKTAKEALATLKAAASSLSDEALRILLADSSMQDIFEKVAVASGTKPGDPVLDANGRQIGNVPFSLEWMMEKTSDGETRFPMVTWIAQRSNSSISWNGVTIAVEEGFTYKTPKPFYDIEMESIAATRDAVRGQRAALQQSDKYFADGVDHAVGWYKRTNAQLLQQDGVER